VKYAYLTNNKGDVLIFFGGDDQLKEWLSKGWEIYIEL